MVGIIQLLFKLGDLVPLLSFQRTGSPPAQNKANSSSEMARTVSKDEEEKPRQEVTKTVSNYKCVGSRQYPPRIPIQKKYGKEVARTADGSVGISGDVGDSYDSADGNVVIRRVGPDGLIEGSAGVFQDRQRQRQDRDRQGHDHQRQRHRDREARDHIEFDYYPPPP